MRHALSALSDALSFALEHLLDALYHLRVGLVVGCLHVGGAVGVCYPHRIFGAAYRCNDCLALPVTLHCFVEAIENVLRKFGDVDADVLRLAHLRSDDVLFLVPQPVHGRI